MLDKVKEYLKEREKWLDAGQPMRTAEEMEHVYNICASCPFFKKDGGFIPGYDSCSICGCNLHKKNSTLNKIAWKTTECPDNKWN